MKGLFYEDTGERSGKKVRRGRERGGMLDTEEEISRDKIRSAIKKQKAGKALGIDEIPMEV